MITDDIVKFLSIKCNTSKSDIVDKIKDIKINKNDAKMFKFLVNQIEYTYDITKHILYNDNSIYDYAKFVADNNKINFFNDDDDVVILDDLENNTSIMKELKDNYKFLCVNAFCGCGKSYYLIKPYMEYLDSIDYDGYVIHLTELNTTNQQSFKKFKDIGFVSHLDNDYTSKRIITSIESLYKFKSENTILIIDEVISIIDKFLSSTTQQNRTKIFKVLVDIIKNCKQLVLLDADLNSDYINYFKNIINYTPKIYFVKNNKYDKIPYNIHIDTEQFYNKIITNIKNNKSLWCLSTTKNKIYYLIRYIQRKIYNYHYLKYYSLTNDDDISNDIKNEYDELDNNYIFVVLTGDGIDIYKDKFKTEINYNKSTFKLDENKNDINFIYEYLEDFL